MWWLAEQYVGSVASDYVSSPLTRFLVSSFQWGKEYPGQISMTLFFLAFTYLVIQVLRDTQPVKDIPVTVEYQTARWGVIKITNLTGDDLFNCTLHIVTVDDVETKDRHLEWFRGMEQRELQNGRSGAFYLQDIRNCLISGRDPEGKALYDGKIHHVEVFFRGNTMKNQTLSMRIWIPVRVESVELDERGNSVHRVIISAKIETAPPAFG